jgi:serine/threonine protein kinase
VLLPIVRGLEAAHGKGIFHRDCKPANILFRADGTPVLGNFGICYVDDGELVTLSDEGMGSKNFIAPEMESGGTVDVSEAVDVYSLAKVLTIWETRPSCPWTRCHEIIARIHHKTMYAPPRPAVPPRKGIHDCERQHCE